MGLTMTTFSWGSVEAMPTEGQVRSGDAEIKTSGQTMEIDQKTPRVALDWSTFDIAKGETVRFNQRPTDIALNRILGNKASEIYGNLQAGGTVFLLNPQGILFGQGAQVDVGNLIASTAQVNDSFMTGFSAGGDVSLNLGEASKGKVINAGEIKAQGGLVALHATNVENTGSIKNDGGKVSLAAVKNLELAIDTAGKINFETNGEIANAHTLNAGTIQADGGYVVMTAKSAGDMLSEVVNNTGIIEAKTASINDKGEILLDGGDHGTVNVGGTLDASGLSEGQSGGTVRIVGENTSVKAGTKLTASGDKDGGLVETSGDVLDVSTKADIEASGRTGKAGEWLLDPVDVIITNNPSPNYELVNDNTKAGEFTSISSDAKEKHSYISADYISWRLSNGTNVRVQAIDDRTTVTIPYDLHASTIAVNSPITKSKENMTIKGPAYTNNKDNDAILTLEAERNVSVNAPITATDGKLTVNLHADTDGEDSKGMVVVNADINTNGGDFTAGTGKKISDGTVGTYFGHSDNDKDKGDDAPRNIITNGGDVNLYGDVALGLNKGTLHIDTSRKASETGGAVNITGNVDSMNTYKVFVNNTGSVVNVKDDDNMMKIAKYYYNEHLKDIAFLDFTTLVKKVTIDKDEHYIKLYKELEERCFSHKTNLPTDEKGREKILKQYFNDYVKLGTKETGTDFDSLSPEEYNLLAEHILVTSDYNNNSRESILNRWENAKESAKEGTAGGSAIGDKYLATITTALEEWVVSSKLAGKKYQLFLGGRTDYKVMDENGNPRLDEKGKRIINKQIGTDMYGIKVRQYTEGRVFRWETGPEAGTVFYTTTGPGNGYVSENMYQGWSHDVTNPDVNKKCNDPDNNSDYEQPYVAVSWRCDTGWSDVDNQKSNVRGFVQETNTEHSGFNVQSGNKNVTIGGNVGKSVALKDMTIGTTGNVKIGGSINHASSDGGTFTGQVHTDGAVSINGNAGVDIGDRITSTAGGVEITSKGNITTKGITANGNVKLVTEGKEHRINLGANIITDSTAKDAVIIDAHDGNFINNSTEKKGIVTGEGGNWKIYSYSPSTDQFDKDDKRNLNSDTYALWGRNSDTYAYTAVQTDNPNAIGRYIFQDKPVVTFTTDNRTKIYGEEADNTTTWTASAKVAEKDVLTYQGTAFDEKTVLDAAKVTDGADSQGFASTANVGVYDIAMSVDSANAFSTASKAVTHGYELKPAAYQGKITVTPRDLTINNLVGTYGSAEFMPDNKASAITGLVNGDTITKVTYTLSDSYKGKTSGKITAPVGTYTGAVVVDSLDFADAADKNNYNLQHNNATLTIKPKDILLQLAGHGTSLNAGNITVIGTDYGTQLVNGDTLSTVPKLVYDIGKQLTDRTYSIDLLADGQRVANGADGTQVGNYRFQYTGVYTLEPTSEIAERPQFAPLSLTPITGEAGYQEVQGEKSSSVEQVLGLTTAKLPFVKEVKGVLSSYGTYKLAVDPDKVILELVDTSVPVPANGIHDQYREYSKKLITGRGSADFKLSYDDSVFALHPIGQEAEKMLEAGDAAHNVDVVSQALYTAFHDMGLTLDDLDAVYVCFA